MVKHLPTVWEAWVRSLGWEDPLEKEMATHSSTLAWKISWTEEPSRLQSVGSQRVRHDWVTSLSLFTFTSYLIRGEKPEKSLATSERAQLHWNPGTSGLLSVFKPSEGAETEWAIFTSRTELRNHHPGFQLPVPKWQPQCSCCLVPSIPWV